VLGQERLDLAFCLGDGGVDDAEEPGEHVPWGAEADAQDGDQGLFGDGERGRVTAGGLAGGRPAAGDLEPGFALGLVGDLQDADQLVPFGVVEAGQGRVRPSGALGLAGGRRGLGRRV
jgi:hypothetical protein